MVKIMFYLSDIAKTHALWVFIMCDGSDTKEEEKGDHV